MKYVLYLVLLCVLLIFGFTSSSNVYDDCNDENYIYWPMTIDSIEIYSSRVQEYLRIEDSLLYIIASEENKLVYNWKKFYNLGKRYEMLEAISKGTHPKNEEKYREYKKLYYKFAKAIRMFNARKKIFNQVNKIK